MSGKRPKTGTIRTLQALSSQQSALFIRNGIKRTAMTGMGEIPQQVLPRIPRTIRVTNNH
jgi:hypothetical protein